MEGDRELFNARCNSAEGRKTYKEKWEHLSNILNEDAEGPSKTTSEWQRVWANLKNKIKAKASAIQSHIRGTGGGPPISSLNEFEERVSALIGFEAIRGLPVEEGGWEIQGIPSTSRTESEGSIFGDCGDPLDVPHDVQPIQPIEPRIRGRESSVTSNENEPSPKRRKITPKKDVLQTFTNIQIEQTASVSEISDTLKVMAGALEEIKNQMILTNTTNTQIADAMISSTAATNRLADAIENYLHSLSTSK